MSFTLPTDFATAPGLPFVGSLLPLSRNALRLFTKLSAEHGDRVRLHIPGRTILLLQHPHDLEQVLVRDKEHYGRSAELRKLRPVFGNGLVVSEGDHWRRQRTFIQPHFNHSALAMAADLMVDSMQQVLSHWSAGDTRDMLPEMLQYTGTTICRVLFGSTFGPSDSGVDAAIRTVFGGLQSEILYLPLWRRLPLRKSRRWNRAAHLLDSVIQQTIAERRRAPEAHADMLQGLMDARDANGEAMADQQLHDEIITFFIGGYETAALALTWSTYLLARYPDVQRAVQQEIRSVIQGPGIQASDFVALRLTQAVVKEALRLYPPAWSIGRRSLPGAVLGGEELAPGTDIWMNLHGLHHDARWYDEPQQFRPERWLRGQTQTPYTYLPFGIGPRVCIGQHFATAEATLGLASVLAKFTLAQVDGDVVEPSAWVTLRPARPVFLKLSPA